MAASKSFAAPADHAHSRTPISAALAAVEEGEYGQASGDATQPMQEEQAAHMMDVQELGTGSKDAFDNATDQSGSEDGSDTEDGFSTSELAEQSRKRLKSRFESIFAKYERDFTGVGDEIDLETGIIVVDNGHLEGMQHELEARPGQDDPARLVRDFEAELRREDDDVSSYNDSEEEGVAEPDDETDINVDPALLDKDRVAAPQDGTQGLSVARDEAEDVEGADQADASFDVMSMPAMKRTLESIQSQFHSGQELDTDALSALGVNIADQIAKFIGVNRSKSKRKAKSGGLDPAWKYPELPAFKKRRTTNHQRQPLSKELSAILSSANDAAVKDSLWAPDFLTQRRKTARRKIIPRPETESIVANGVDEQPAEVVAESTAKARGKVPRLITETPPLQECHHCQIRATTTWRTGPNGEDLCNACGMYWAQWELMRPLRPSSSHGEKAADKQTFQSLNGHTRRHGPFTVEEDALIIKLKEVDEMSWEAVGRYFPERSHYAIQCRYSKKLRNIVSEGRDALIEQGFEFGEVQPEQAPDDSFDDEQDELLVQLREEHELEWNVIANRLPGKTAEAIEHRYNILLGFTEEEPAAFNQGKRKHANPRYANAPKNHSRPYTREEDELLIKLREVDKLPWEILAQEFTERTWLSLQKRYVRTLAQRHQIMRDGGDDPFQHLFLLQENDEDVRMGPASRRRMDALLDQRREEDDLLMRLKDKQGFSFGEIAERIPGRSVQSLANRYHYLKEVNDTMNVPTPTSPIVGPGGVRPGSSEPRTGPNVDPALQDASRLNALLAAVDHTKPAKPGSKYTKIEHNLVIELRARGMHWNEIAKHLPGRTAHSLSGYWNQHCKHLIVPMHSPWEQQNNLLRQALYSGKKRIIQDGGKKPIELPDLSNNAHPGPMNLFTTLMRGPPVTYNTPGSSQHANEHDLDDSDQEIEFDFAKLGGSPFEKSSPAAAPRSQSAQIAPSTPSRSSAQGGGSLNAPPVEQSQSPESSPHDANSLSSDARHNAPEDVPMTNASAAEVPHGVLKCSSEPLPTSPARAHRRPSSTPVPMRMAPPPRSKSSLDCVDNDTLAHDAKATSFSTPAHRPVTPMRVGSGPHAATPGVVGGDAYDFVPMPATTPFVAAPAPALYSSPALFNDSSMPYFVGPTQWTSTSPPFARADQNASSEEAVDGEVDNAETNDNTVVLAVAESDSHKRDENVSSSKFDPVRMPAPPASSPPPQESGQAVLTGNAPPFSWNELITMALKSSHTQHLTSREIEAYLEDKFSYFKTSGPDWKRTFKARLRSSGAFQQTDDTDTWTIRVDVPSVPQPKRRDRSRLPPRSNGGVETLQAATQTRADASLPPLARPEPGADNPTLTAQMVQAAETPSTISPAPSATQGQSSAARRRKLTKSAAHASATLDAIHSEPVRLRQPDVWSMSDAAPTTSSVLSKRKRGRPQKYKAEVLEISHRESENGPSRVTSRSAKHALGTRPLEDQTLVQYEIPTTSTDPLQANDTQACYATSGYSSDPLQRINSDSTSFLHLGAASVKRVNKEDRANGLRERH